MPVVPLGVVVEEDRPGAFLTEDPDEVYARGHAAQVPYICSGTSDEVALTLEAVQRFQRFYSRIRPSSGRTAEMLFRNFAPTLLEYQYTTDNPEYITDKIIDFYLREDGRDRLGNLSAFGLVSEFLKTVHFTDFGQLTCILFDS